MNKRVLILSASAGAGHVRAGQALAKVFAGDQRVEAVEHLDALEYTNKLFRDFYSKLYLRIIRSAPQLFGWVYRASDEPWKTDAVRLRLDRLQAQRLVRFIHKFRPDIIVCTHFMPTGIIAHLIQRRVLHAHLSIVVTDFDLHALWLSRTFHRYFVAIGETKAFLQTLGVPEERVTVSGIPIDPAFTRPVDKAVVRAQLGLDDNRPVILFSAGAAGIGPVEFIVHRLLHLRHAAQTVVLCGRNEEMRQRVSQAVGERQADFRVLGFTEHIHELMHAADLLISKPGGLTVAEALACGLPIVVVAPIPGQEERNSDHLLENGAAIRCNELATLAYKIDRLFEEPGRLPAMRERARALGRPDAARTIAQVLIEDHLPPLEIH